MTRRSSSPLCQVSEAITAFPGGRITEAIVYGVAVPRHDGRAGMAALVLPPSLAPPDLDWAALARHLQGALAPYAIPLFMRVLSTPPLTETLKHVKHALREEGADPTAAREGGDPVYILSLHEEGGAKYVPLTAARWHMLVGGAGPRL